uniref:Proprotein convertase subtilisin/kexin type 6 n=1 Tax=Athene cunicularia TaxID=194338 RepID=A0A663N168_ATHCN
MHLLLGKNSRLGHIGSLENYYHFHHSRTFKRSTLSSRGPHNFLRMDPKVDWLQQQEVKRRVKRQVRGEPHALPFNDPVWPNMWYLHCGDKSSRCRSEMNVLAAWQRGYTGKNVVVTILDDGIERNHPDLLQNYDPLASYDVNGNDHDPTPRYDASNENKHGTRCAGEVAAAANNSYCIVGIAYNARIGGIRMLDGDVTDVVEAKSLGIRPDYIDIYSASWGPDDDGKTVDGPGLLAKQAFEHGIKKGRRGLGSIFVWASGNGGREGDYCSCDGYTNSIYTISISSTTENGYKPWYLEECASTLATTYSSGAFYERKIVTTDLRHRCTDGHTGTSVSAPMVAGIIALALEANPLLTWRDVQHLLVKTSRPVHLRAADWKTNGAGHKVSHLYGFGLVDADAIVVEAKKWKAVPPQHICVGSLDRVPKYIRADHVLRASTLSSACADHRDQHVLYLEHVVVRLSISHPRRGDLQISLISPKGTRSQLLARRVFDHSNEGFKGWEFMTVHCWGERAAGEWTLEIHDTPSQVRNPAVQGKLKEWSLLFYGTAEHPYTTLGSPQSRGRTLEVPALEMEPSRAAFLQSQVEVVEEEEEYAASLPTEPVSPSSGPCHPECGDQGCDGPNADQCLNCIHYSLGSMKTGRMCVSSCPAGFFGDKGARRCRRCYKGCERCVGRGPTQCTACKRSLYHHQEMSTCVVLCPPGFYAEERQKRCLKCHQSCKKCVGEADKCTACKDGFSLAGESCVPECQPTMYLSWEPRQCETCPASTGPGEEDCAPCTPEGPAPHWRCVPSCREGFYPANSHGLPNKVCKRYDATPVVNILAFNQTFSICPVAVLEELSPAPWPSMEIACRRLGRCWEAAICSHSLALWL